MGINTSPYQNGDPRIGLGIVQSLTRSSLGFVPIWDFRVSSPILERHSKWGPHIGTGIPESLWVGICLYSKSGSPRIGMGFIPIWGPTHTPKKATFASRVRYIFCVIRSRSTDFAGARREWDAVQVPLRGCGNECSVCTQSLCSIWLIIAAYAVNSFLR
jgi:hypothetical protein